MVSPAGGFGFLDRIVDVHFGADYITVHGGSQLIVVDNPTPPSAPSIAFAIPRVAAVTTGAKLTFEAHPTSSSSTPGTIWYAFASPSGQTTLQHPFSFGYDTLADFLLANPSGNGPEGFKPQGIPPDPGFPGSTDPMTNEDQALTFAAYISRQPANPNGTTYNGHTYLNPARWVAKQDGAVARRSLSEDAVFTFSGPGPVCSMKVAGTAAGDINTGGFQVKVFSNVKAPHNNRKIDLNYLSTLVPDWEIFRDFNNGLSTLDGTFLFTVSKGVTLFGTPGLRISAPGFFDHIP